jgi:hypothetical protein
VTIVNSVVDPKLFVTDPDPTFQGVSDPDQTSKKFPGSDPKYLLFLRNHDFRGFNYI